MAPPAQPRRAFGALLSPPSLSQDLLCLPCEGSGKALLHARLISAPSLSPVPTLPLPSLCHTVPSTCF